MMVLDTKGMSPNEALKRVADVEATMMALGMTEVREAQVAGLLQTISDFLKIYS